MGYYQGDYYRGDYYRGDPFLGAIGGLVGGLALKAGKAIVKKVKGGGGGAKVVVSKPPIGSGTSIVRPVQAGMFSLGGGSAGAGPGAPAGQHKKPGVRGAIERFLPGGKSGYLRNRRMNVTNVRALRRAGRRLKGFLKLASRLGALPVNRGKGRRLFKRKTRR